MKDKFLSKIRENITKYNLIEEGDTVIVALSGGADSMSLLYSLVQIQKYNIESDFSPKFHIVAAHLNHCFRDEADNDERFCIEWCKSIGIDLKSKKVDCNELGKARCIGSEEAGRVARYEFFGSIAKELSCDNLSKIKIATGHNKNDQAETLLFRMFRGSGIDGMAGIDFKSINSLGNTVIRPILNIERQDIENYCNKNNLQPRSDETNFQTIYTRNKIRLELIPKIENILSINVSDSLWRLSENIKEDKEYLDSLAIESYKEVLLIENDKEISFEQKKIKQLPPSIWRRIIVKAFYNLGLHQQISKTQIEGVKNIINIIDEPKSVDITKEYKIVVAYGKVSCLRIDEKEEKSLNFTVKIIPKDVYDEIKIKEKGNLEDINEESFKSIILSFDKLQAIYGRDVVDKLHFRKRESGDYIKLKKGKKKIKNLFIDMKVPRHIRKNIDLLAIASDVIWVYDSQGNINRLSDGYRVDDTTRTLLIIELSQ